jgi:hypothetical protein
MNTTFVNEIPDHDALARQIDDALVVSRSLVDVIEDVAGIQLFLDIERKITDCLKDLGIPLRKNYLESDSPQIIMERVAMRIKFVLGACNDLRIYDPARADRLLADLAATTCDVQAKLHLLNDPEWSGQDWGN